MQGAKRGGILVNTLLQESPKDGEEEGESESWRPRGSCISQGRTAHGGLIWLRPPPSSTAAPDGSHSILFPSFRCSQIKKALAGTPD